MDLRLQESVALITGGASGLGAATAMLFAEEGANVIIADRDLAPARPIIDAIESRGGTIVALAMDVRDEAQVAAMFKLLKERFHTLDYAVNCAGIQQQKPFLDVVPGDWDTLLDINLSGVWRCMQQEVALMSGGGAIVNVASTAGLRAFPLLSAYTASKHGVVGLTRAAALEVAVQGIRVNCICPGIIRTPMSQQALAATGANVGAITAGVPMQRWGEADEFAALAVWLCSPRASYITGSALAVDGGMTQH